MSRALWQISIISVCISIVFRRFINKYKLLWFKLAYKACKFRSEIIISLVCKNRKLTSCETQTYQVVGDCTDSNSFSSHTGKPVTQLIEVQFWSGHNHCFQYSLLTSCKKEESCENVTSTIITWQTSRRSATRLFR